MTNAQLIKSVQIWALGITLAAGIFGFSSKVESAVFDSSQQNSNSSTSGSQNKNTSRSKNDSTGTTQNQNADSRNATGERAGMSATTAPDQEFLTEAAMGGMMEVELGRWATVKGTTDAVKQFGRKMVDDHSSANQELMQLATSKGITLPTALDEKHRMEVSKLTRLTGTDFDKAYSKLMLKDHTKDVAAFQKQSTGATDAEVKAFATKTLPTLEEHLSLAKTLNGSPASGPKPETPKEPKPAKSKEPKPATPKEPKPAN